MSGPLRVGLVIKEFDEGRGGAERYATLLARELLRMGHEVHVFCHRTAAEAVPGVAIRPVRMLAFSPTARFLSFPRYAREAYGKSGLDVVHGLTQIWPQDVHRAGGGVHRVWVRIQRPRRFTRFFHQATPRELARRHVESRIYRAGNYAFIMTNSELVRRHVLAEFDAPPERVVVVRNGVDHTRFHPGVRAHREAVRRELGIPAAAFVALFASSNFPRKGLDVLLRAAVAVRGRGSELAVVAAGSARPDRFRALAESLGIAGSVRFPGHVTAIERLYGAADAFVLPTLYDPFSNACLEAMACGLPVVTTRDNGASEVLAHGESGLVMGDPRDDLALAGFLCDLAEPGRAERMGRRAAEASAAFTPARHAQETVLLYRRAIEVRNWDWSGRGI